MYEHDFCEYAVEKRKEGAYLAKICVVVLAAALLALALIWVVMPLAGSLWGMIGFGLLCVGIWYLSRFTAIEYEYTQTGATLDFAAIYSKQYRKEKLSVDLKKNARSIAPYQNGQFPAGTSVQSVLDLRSSASVKNAYALVYQDDKVQRAVLFDATRRMIVNLSHQVPSITVFSGELPEE